MAPSTTAETEEQLKAALWYAIGQLTDHETLRHGGSNATPQFIGALTEMAWAQVAGAARDLEAFARHAGRAQVAADDVLLLARRNEGLEALLRRELERVRAERQEGRRGAGRGRGR